MIVSGTIKNSNDSMDFEVYLEVEDISEDAMTIDESTRLIINAINQKYRTTFPKSSMLNPVRVNKSIDKTKDISNHSGWYASDLKIDKGDSLSDNLLKVSNVLEAKYCKQNEALLLHQVVKRDDETYTIIFHKYQF
ncbi:hypothetical protein P5656_20430 [Bacillus subtilis]|nr:hypothetical protein P5656_20430 [Bacillus subtilis]